MSHWHVIQTVAQRERSVGAELNRAAGLAWYVPIETSKITVRARTLERKRPLLPGYLFLNGLEPGAFHDVIETKNVIAILDGLISNPEVAAIRRLEAEHNRALEAEHNRALEDWRQARTTYRVDDRVRVTKGAFQSMETLITAIRGSKAVLDIPMLGTRSVSVPLEALEKVA